MQCCEHLNRCLVVEYDCVVNYDLETVSVLSCPEAGGALALVAMDKFNNAVIVESILAHAGMDIGNTLIGMHLKRVAVPVRVETANICWAQLTPGQDQA